MRDVPGDAECRLLVVGSDFRGEALDPDLFITVRIHLSAEQLVVRADAPWWADPAPAAPLGPTPRLWEHSAVELFLMGPGGRYVEIELGPFGHYLALELQAFRVLLRSDLTCAYQVTRQRERWQGEARVALADLPPRPWRLSACAIWGRAEARQFAMANPTGGQTPDFHQLAAFGAAW